MRVGVFVTDPAPTEGGAHTFQQQLLAELQSRGTVPGIEWVIIGSVPVETSHGRNRSSMTPAFDAYLSADPRRHLGGLLAQAVRLTVHREPSGSLLPGASRISSTYFARRLSELGLDFLWSLSLSIPTQDIPYAVTLWDLQHRLQPWFPEVSGAGQWEARERVIPRALRRAALIFTGTSVGALDAARTYGVPEGNFRVIPMPVPSDVQAAGPGTSTPVNVGQVQGNYILYPAQFWSHKNHHVLIAALSLLRSSGRRTPRLVLCGSDKGNEQYVRDLARTSKVSDLVEFRGFVERDELLFLYEHADAVVFPSFFGPDNLPPLEAMAMGCPVVVSDDEGMKEQLGDAVLYASPVEPEAWAAAIHRILAEPDHAEALRDAGLSLTAGRTVRAYVAQAISSLQEFHRIRASWPLGSEDV